MKTKRENIARGNLKILRRRNGGDGNGRGTLKVLKQLKFIANNCS